MKNKLTIKQRIKACFILLVSGSYLCKIGIHKYNYTYQTGMSGWSMYDGYCEKCWKHKSGLA